MNTRKKIKIIKRSEAIKILKSNKKYWSGKWCAGKYNWKGSQDNWIGKEWEVTSDILAIYVISGRDTEGAFATIMCVSGRTIN